MKINFHFIVPVWGEKYTDLFANICLPLLLTPGNLYASHYDDDRFIIVTTQKDSLMIKSSNAYMALEKILAIQFIFIDTLIDLTNSYQAMSACYAMAMQQKKVIGSQTYFIFLTPDSFWSEGTFKKIHELAERQYQVVMAIGLRMHAENMLATIKKLNDHGQHMATLPKKELMQIIITHLHPMATALNMLSGHFPNAWPSHLYWIDEQKHQLIAHCFHLHPLMVQAPTQPIDIGISIDGEFIKHLNYPLERYYIFQQDFFCIELTEGKRQWDVPLAQPLLAQIAKFSHLHTNHLHRHFFKHRITLTDDNDTITKEMDTLVSQTVEKIFHLRNTVLYKILFNTFSLSAYTALKKYMPLFFQQWISRVKNSIFMKI